MSEIDRLQTLLVDRYTISRPVGRGGMAMVYLAHDPKHDRDVAIKVLQTEVAAAIGRDRFLREIKIAANLSHPHILPLYDSGQAEELLYYVMPYVTGDSLRERLRREGQLPIEEAVAITAAVASALDYAHRSGVIHRDIKPDNIMFSDGNPLLADFGIARAVGATGSERLTETGLSLGTPAYMSPEQASGDSDVDGRSDVYSLGCVLYEMLAGHPPFTGRNVQAVMARHVTDPVPPISTVRPSVSRSLEQVVMRALEKVAVDRFRTPDDFAKALESARGEEPPQVERSIAVVPFSTLAGGPEADGFSDGLTDEIIAGLSRVRSFRVLSRGTAMQLKGSGQSARAIGTEFNVRFVVEGSVRRSGNAIRVTAQLVDAFKDTPVWSDRYTDQLGDTLIVQDRIGHAIVESLKLQLDSRASAPLGSGRPQNIHAYECYLRARRDVWRFTEPAIVRALQYLQEALGIVGEDVHLYAGIAEAYYVFPQVCGGEVEACMDRVRECTERIVELDAHSAHASWLHGLMRWRTPGENGEGIKHLRRALDLDPNDPGGLFWTGIVASHAGQPELAGRCIERLSQLDPRSPRTRWLSGWHHVLQGNVDAATLCFQEAWEGDRENPRLRWYVAYVRAWQRPEQALNLLMDVPGKDRAANVCVWISKFMRYALKGEAKRASRAVTPELRQAARVSESYSLHMAEAFALIDEKTQALEWLENAIRRGFVNYPFLAEHARFLDGLRAEARFHDLLTSAKHEWETLAS